jgi:SAM-dependent methyltransferase
MRYVFYFIYVAWYWGVDMAIFIIKHEIAGERKYGLKTIGIDTLKGDVSKEDRKHASIYEPVNYYTGTWLFDQLDSQDKQTTLLDAGCGKGRILTMGAAYGFKHLIGIDISRKICNDASQICAGWQPQYPDVKVDITCIDARFYDIPDTVGIIFLFNPFDDSIMEDFIQRVKESLQRKPRFVKVLYANPQFKEMWEQAGFEEINSFTKMTHLRGSVLVKSPFVANSI